MSAGTRLQTQWRWNGKPLRVRITKADDNTWEICWFRWHDYRKDWIRWRCYLGSGGLWAVIFRYRDYAASWRGFE